MRLAVVASTMALLFVGYDSAATVTVVADRDATLIEHPDGALASRGRTFRLRRPDQRR